MVRDVSEAAEVFTEVDDLRTYYLDKTLAMAAEIETLKKHILDLEGVIIGQAEVVEKLNREVNRSSGRQSSPDGFSVAVQNPTGASPVFKGLPKLPRYLHDVAVSFQKLFPERLHFTEKALKSAKHSQFQDVEGAWKVMIAVAETLHDLYFNVAPQKKCNIAKEFENCTGIKLAETEGSATTHNARLMRLRQDQYLGETIDGSLHVKYGHKVNHMLRVHIYVDKAHGKLVITHMGDHLESAADQRK